MQLLSSDLPTLKHALIDEVTDARNLFTTDMSLFSDNDVTSNYKFDYLSGELVSVEAEKIEPSFKSYTTSGGHHEVAKQNLGYKKKTTLDNQFRPESERLTDENILRETEDLARQYNERIQTQKAVEEMSERDFTKHVNDVLSLCSLSVNKTLENTEVFDFAARTKKKYAAYQQIKRDEEEKQKAMEEKKRLEAEKEKEEEMPWDLLDFVPEKIEEAEEPELNVIEFGGSSSNLKEEKINVEELISAKPETKENEELLKANLASAPTFTERVERKGEQPNVGTSHVIFL